MTTITERIDFIKKIHLFADLSDDDLKDVAQALTDEAHKAGDHIIEQGSRGDSFYIVYKGYVRVMRRKDKREEILSQLVPQDYFGEEEVFRKRTRTASIVAVTDCVVLVLHGSKLNEVMKRVPSFKPTFDVVIASHKLWRKLHFKWVRPDEAVYFLARKHIIMLWRSLLAPLFLLLFPTAVLAWGLMTVTVSVIAIALAALVLNLLWVLWSAIDWGNDYYLVTNQRAVWVEKVIGIFDSRTEAPLGTVLSVGVETDTLGRIFGYGHVVVRTFVGRIDFKYVSHPQYAAQMIEEYWRRTKEFTLSAEKEAMKDAIRKRLNLPIPPKAEPPAADETQFSPRRRPGVLRLAIANVFKLRLEEGETVTYRKHGFVLFRQIWQPSLLMLILFVAIVWKLVISIGGAIPFFDTITDLMIFFLLVSLGWWIFQYVNWANDIFQVTPDQIIDIDKTPFGPAERRAAPLENILSTESKRVGVLGNLFNFGTVYISVGGAKLEFQDVFDPNTVQSDIDRRRMARIAAKAAAAAAADRERMAEWIATYHRGAEEFRKEETLRKGMGNDETIRREMNEMTAQPIEMDDAYPGEEGAGSE